MDLITVHHPIIFSAICAVLGVAVFAGGVLVGFACGWLLRTIGKPALTAVAPSILSGSPIGFALTLIHRYLDSEGDPDIAARLLQRAHQLLQDGASQQVPK